MGIPTPRVQFQAPALYLLRFRVPAVIPEEEIPEAETQEEETQEEETQEETQEEG